MRAIVFFLVLTIHSSVMYAQSLSIGGLSNRTCTAFQGSPDSEFFAIGVPTGCTPFWRITPESTQNYDVTYLEGNRRIRVRFKLPNTYRITLTDCSNRSVDGLVEVSQSIAPSVSIVGASVFCKPGGQVNDPETFLADAKVNAGGPSNTFIWYKNRVEFSREMRVSVSVKHNDTIRLVMLPPGNAAPVCFTSPQTEDVRYIKIIQSNQQTVSLTSTRTNWTAGSPVTVQAQVTSNMPNYNPTLDWFLNGSLVQTGLGKSITLAPFTNPATDRLSVKVTTNILECANNPVVDCGVSASALTSDFSVLAYPCAVKLIPTPVSGGSTFYEWNLANSVLVGNTPIKSLSSGTYPTTMKLFYSDLSTRCASSIQHTKNITFTERQAAFEERDVTLIVKVNKDVLQTEASTFSDGWDLDRSLEPLDKSTYELGSKGVWRNQGSYKYLSPRSQSFPISLRKDGVYDLNSFSWKNIETGPIPNWSLVEEVTKYSPYSYAIESRDINGIFSSTLYDYGGHFISASGVNMKNQEIGFTSFEQIPVNNNAYGSVDKAVSGNFVFNDKSFVRYVSFNIIQAEGNLVTIDAPLSEISGYPSLEIYSLPSAGNNYLMSTTLICGVPDPTNSRQSVLVLSDVPKQTFWVGRLRARIMQTQPNQSATDNSYAHSGKWSLKLAGPSLTSSSIQQLIRPALGKKYMMSLWISNKSSERPLNSAFEMQVLHRVNGAQSGTLVATGVPSGPMIDRWQKIDVVFDWPTTPGILEIKFVRKIAADFWIDDLRFHPSDGNMKSFVYNLDNYTLSAILDENNFSKKFIYDAENKLQSIRVETVDGFRTISESFEYIKPNR